LNPAPSAGGFEGTTPAVASAGLSEEVVEEVSIVRTLSTCTTKEPNNISSPELDKAWNCANEYIFPPLAPSRLGIASSLQSVAAVFGTRSFSTPSNHRFRFGPPRAEYRTTASIEWSHSVGVGLVFDFESYSEFQNEINLAQNTNR
jgi:hypothetical protein